MHATKAYGGVELHKHAFLIQTLNGC